MMVILNTYCIQPITTHLSITISLINSIGLRIQESFSMIWGIQFKNFPGAINQKSCFLSVTQYSFLRCKKSYFYKSSCPVVCRCDIYSEILYVRELQAVFTSQVYHFRGLVSMNPEWEAKWYYQTLQSTLVTTARFSFSVVMM